MTMLRLHTTLAVLIVIFSKFRFVLNAPYLKLILTKPTSFDKEAFLECTAYDVDPDGNFYAISFYVQKKNTKLKKYGEVVQRGLACQSSLRIKPHYVSYCGKGATEKGARVRKYLLVVRPLARVDPLAGWICCMDDCDELKSNTENLTPLSICNIKKCENDGIAEKDLQTCKCDCKNSWNGRTCGTCSLKCLHEATPIERNCSCQCKGRWMGKSCGVCGITLCEHDGTKVDGKCTCKCPAPWAGDACDKCNLKCPNGEIDQKTCTCKCRGNWKGKLCDFCPPFTCLYDGQVNRKDCRCICRKHRTGPRCETCSIHCKHGGILQKHSCSCICKFSWSGDACGKCDVSECLHQGTLEHKYCHCFCKNNWSGNKCDRCSAYTKCINGGTFHKEACRCECGRYWIGDKCEYCLLQCENGAVLDEESCKCQCQGEWGGDKCDTKVQIHPEGIFSSLGGHVTAFSIVTVIVISGAFSLIFFLFRRKKVAKEKEAKLASTYNYNYDYDNHKDLTAYSYYSDMSYIYST